jgi:hypothetical protein
LDLVVVARGYETDGYQEGEEVSHRDTGTCVV